MRDGISADCDLGEPLTERVGVFIGITGANYGYLNPAERMMDNFFVGMCACEGLSLTDKTCSPIVNYLYFSNRLPILVHMLNSLVNLNNAMKRRILHSDSQN